MPFNINALNTKRFAKSLNDGRRLTCIKKHFAL